jgi:hypothetical protein
MSHFSLAHLLLEIHVEAVELKDPAAFVEEAWQYALPSIVTFCTTVIGFKVLSALLSAGKGE